MRFLEIILLLLVLFGGGLGIRRGFIRELLGVALVLGAAFLSLTFTSTTRSVLSVFTTFEDGPRAEILPWIVGFVTLYLVILVVLFILRRPLKKLRFKGDAISGAILGILRMALLIALLLPAAAWAFPENSLVRRTVTGTRPWGWLRNGAARAHEAPFVPKAYVKFVEDTPEIWQ